jgi:hypothetical protein
MKMIVFRAAHAARVPQINTLHPASRAARAKHVQKTVVIPRTYLINTNRTK